MSSFDYDFDEARPPERKRYFGGKKKKKKKKANVSGDGGQEMMMVPDAEFDSYYGRSIVKPPPWEWPIAGYLFLGGVAGGSAILAEGGRRTGRPRLRRNGRILSLATVGLGSLFLVEDLGRPSRFLNMMRVVKLSSPMSLGSWILASFATSLAMPALTELDKITYRKFPLPKFVRRFIHWSAKPAGTVAAGLGGLLATYTSVLLGGTSNPAWSGARKYLPFLFASSASLAAGGATMLVTPVSEAGPARKFALAGAAGDILVTKLMDNGMHPVENEPYHTGKPGQWMHWAEILVITGALSTATIGRNQVGAAVSGAMLMTASALTRFGVVYAGLESTKDPKYVVEPQRDRLKARQEQGITGDSITTAF